MRPAYTQQSPDPILPGKPHLLREDWYDVEAAGEWVRAHAFALATFVLLTWAPVRRTQKQQERLAELQAQLEEFLKGDG
jgi:hypothetical protein